MSNFLLGSPSSQLNELLFFVRNHCFLRWQNGNPCLEHVFHDLISFNASFSPFDMFGRTFVTAAVLNTSVSMFSINNSKLLMFVSLGLYKDAYLASRTGGDENELLILLLLHPLGSMEVDWDCLAL